MTCKANRLHRRKTEGEQGDWSGVGRETGAVVGLETGGLYVGRETDARCWVKD